MQAREGQKENTRRKDKGKQSESIPIWLIKTTWENPSKRWRKRNSRRWSSWRSVRGMTDRCLFPNCQRAIMQTRQCNKSPEKAAGNWDEMETRALDEKRKSWKEKTENEFRTCKAKRKQEKPKRKQEKPKRKQEKPKELQKQFVLIMYFNGVLDSQDLEGSKSNFCCLCEHWAVRSQLHCFRPNIKSCCQIQTEGNQRSKEKLLANHTLENLEKCDWAVIANRQNSEFSSSFDSVLSFALSASFLVFTVFSFQIWSSCLSDVADWTELVLFFLFHHRCHHCVQWWDLLFLHPPSLFVFTHHNLFSSCNLLLLFFSSPSLFFFCLILLFSFFSYPQLFLLFSFLSFSPEYFPSLHFILLSLSQALSSEFGFMLLFLFFFAFSDSKFEYVVILLLSRLCSNSVDSPSKTPLLPPLLYLHLLPLVFLLVFLVSFKWSFLLLLLFLLLPFFGNASPPSSVAQFAWWCWRAGTFVEKDVDDDDVGNDDAL